MTAQQPLQIPGIDELDPDVRTAALHILGNARSPEYLPGAVERAIAYHPSRLSEILQYLAIFGYEVLRLAHRRDAGPFISDELDIAEAAQLLEHLDKEVAEWKQGT